MKNYGASTAEGKLHTSSAELNGLSPAALPGQAWSAVERLAKQVLLSNIRTFSTSVVNEFRFGYTQFNNDQKRFFAGVRNVTGELGINGLNSPVELSWGTPPSDLDLVSPDSENKGTGHSWAAHPFFSGWTTCL